MIVSFDSFFRIVPLELVPLSLAFDDGGADPEDDDASSFCNRSFLGASTPFTVIALLVFADGSLSSVRVLTLSLDGALGRGREGTTGFRFFPEVSGDGGGRLTVARLLVVEAADRVERMDVEDGLFFTVGNGFSGVAFAFPLAFAAFLAFEVATDDATLDASEGRRLRTVAV